MKDLPPPVTPKSSKKELWEELECSRAEAEHQQARIGELMQQVKRLNADLANGVAANNSYEWTFNVIRALVSSPVAEGKL